MTKASLKVTAWPLIAGPVSGPRQAIGLTWEDAAPPPAIVLVDGEPQHIEWTEHHGQLRRATVFIPLPATKKIVRLTISQGAHQLEIDCAIEPPSHWELFLVPHSHVDIGYTEYQDILSDAHGDYIAQALDIMKETDTLPDEQQYRWTCEVSWSVEQFLRRHPVREQEFVRRVREGRMEVTALYVTLTDLFSEELLARSVHYALALREQYGIEIVTACNYDINGFGWALPRILKQAGIRYLDTAINETRALGVRPRPSALQWAAPDGSDVLLWHSAGYLIGNTLLLHKSVERAEPLVAEFLNRLRLEDYPHCGIELLISGIAGDSMPPSAEVCTVVANWNHKWLWPKLHLATVRQWFEHLESQWPDEIVRYQQAWPDWWADGNGSALYESALVRKTQARLVDLEAQLTVLGRYGINLHHVKLQYETAWKRAMLFCEHTWGAYESAIQPDSAASRGQWYNKASHVYAAAALADSIEVEQMVALATNGCVSARMSGLTNATLQGEPAGYLASDHPAAVLVFNPLTEVRSDIIYVHVPGHFSNGRVPQLRDSMTGQVVSTQVRHYAPENVVNVNHFQVEFFAVDLPPNGHRVFWIEEGSDSSATAGSAVPDNQIENRYVRVRLDSASGAIESIMHKASGRELVQRGTGYVLNQCVYEQVDSPEGRNAIASWRGIGDRQVVFNRTTPTIRQIVRDIVRPFAESLLVTTAGANGLYLSTEITLYDHIDRIDITNTLNKPSSTSPEAVYHAFPLATPRGQIYLDVPGGVMRPGLDQVPGTATDWHSIQDWFAVAESDYTIVVASPDVPLVQCTAINTGMWQPSLPVSNRLVMSWVLNNYWFTNFPVRHVGSVTYRYSITLQKGPFDPDRASRFARSVRHRAWGYAVRLMPEMASKIM